MVIMKTIEKELAVGLRKQGLTYREILKTVPVSKSSLSYWLKDIRLSFEQQRRIQYKNEGIRRKFVEYNEVKSRQARETKESIIKDAEKEIGGLSRRELQLVGIALYWAEGYKAHACSTVEFVNTDPAMINLAMRWFREICGVDDSQFRIRIQAHNPNNIEKAEEYWSRKTGVPIEQFTKAYTKISSGSKRKSGNLAPYGICSIRVSDVKLFSRIRGWLQGFMALSSSPA